VRSPAPHPHPVLVGISDTPSGRAAVDAAARIARQERAPLALVRVWRDVDWFLSAEERTAEELARDLCAEQRLFAASCAHARTVAPDVDVRGELAPGSIFGVLLERTDHARRLVLGTSGSESEPGDVSSWYLDHARCPVTVVAPDGTVAAASDGRAVPRMATFG
jgi:nucleotide-binding universal stress UspA family protein